MAGAKQFDDREFASLAENNLLTFVAAPVIERAFEEATSMLFEFEGDWTRNLFRVVVTLVAYNGIKAWTLYHRDSQGESDFRRKLSRIWHWFVGTKS